MCARRRRLNLRIYNICFIKEHILWTTHLICIHFVTASEETLSHDIDNFLVKNDTEYLDGIIPQALLALNKTINGTDNCGRVNIMGTIVQDSSPYLYPFIIEYSLIGATVIYVMWKHIGRNPR